ncbi:MAG: esterase-like activity of phytase family protein [Sphingomonadaceae bacterium]|nr:esterase-like activity of phytase family protein [Sphingomonadaceae bacterium]
MILWGFPEQLWRSRGKRAAFVALVFAALATNIALPPEPPLPGPAMAMLEARPVALDESAPARRRVGSLDFLGGWVLTSDSARFGGLSTLHVENGQVAALSDTGTLFRFAVPQGAGREPVRIDPLGDGPGPATRKSNRDTESMVILGPWLWAGFERHNMIWRFRLADLSAAASAAPPLMRDWRANSGPEAMVRLADGRFLVFCEGSDDERPLSDVVLFGGDPADPRTPAQLLHYRRVPGYRVSDATLLPDGRLLVLNRRFEWLEGFSLAVTVADLPDLRPGATIVPHELARLQPPLTIDNMEGVSATVEDGRTIVWLVSDDNFFPLQRTLLLKFALAG